jgi:hypothetical protein
MSVGCAIEACFLLSANIVMQLCDDILSNVFSCIDDAKDLVACGRVCKQWYCSHRDDKYWKRVYKRYWDVWNQCDDPEGLRYAQKGNSRC